MYTRLRSGPPKSVTAGLAREIRDLRTKPLRFAMRGGAWKTIVRYPAFAQRLTAGTYRTQNVEFWHYDERSGS